MMRLPPAISPRAKTKLTTKVANDFEREIMARLAPYYDERESAECIECLSDGDYGTAFGTLLLFLPNLRQLTIEYWFVCCFFGVVIKVVADYQFTISNTKARQETPVLHDLREVRVKEDEDPGHEALRLFRDFFRIPSLQTLSFRRVLMGEYSPIVSHNVKSEAFKETYGQSQCWRWLLCEGESDDEDEEEEEEEDEDEDEDGNKAQDTESAEDDKDNRVGEAEVSDAEDANDEDEKRE